MFEDLSQNVRYGVRTLARNPGFTAMAVLACLPGYPVAGRQAGPAAGRGHG